MATVAGTLGRPHIRFPALWTAGALALVAAHAVIASRLPLVDLGLAVVCAFLFFPRVRRVVLLGIAAAGPTINPPLFGLGANNGGGVAGGRIYVVQALIVLVIIGGVAHCARNGMQVQAVAVTALAVLLVLVQTVGRPHAGPAWIYRPFQLFLLCFAVRSLYAKGRDRPLLLALAWGSAIGCALASLNALVPTFDPFEVSRPTTCRSYRPSGPSPGPPARSHTRTTWAPSPPTPPCSGWRHCCSTDRPFPKVWPGCSPSPVR